jgi:hypothetical protein
LNMLVPDSHGNGIFGIERLYIASKKGLIF